MSNEIRKVGMRIAIPSVGDNIRTQSSAEFVDASAFTAASSASMLLDGDSTQTCAVTSGTQLLPQIRITPPAGSVIRRVRVVLDTEMDVPNILFVVWKIFTGETYSYNMSHLSMTDSKGVFTFMTDGEFLKPTEIIVGFECPGLNVGVKEVYIGTDPTEPFDICDDKLISLKIYEGVDMKAKSFKSKSLVFEADNRENLFGQVDYTGAMIEPFTVIDGQEHSIGKFYIDKIVFNNLGLTATVHASDIVTRMQRYMTGINVGYPMALSELLAHPVGAVYGIAIDADPYVQAAVVAPYMIGMMDTQKNCLLKLAQAARGANIWIARDGTIRMSCLANYSGYDYIIRPEDVIAFESVTMGQRTDYYRIDGDSYYGTTVNYDGYYTGGCLTDRLKNDYFYSGEGKTIAKNLRRADNYRYKIVLKTRCDPELIIGRRVLVLGPNQDSLGEFVIFGQTIEFDKSGLSSRLELAAFA